MERKDFWYDLPPHLIAQSPLEKRDSSRLLVLNKQTGEVEESIFSNILNYLRPGDLLVMNNSRVLPARLIGELDTGREVEVLLLADKGGDVWECLTRPGKKTRKGTRICFGGGLLWAEVVDVLDDGNRLVHFEYEGIFLELLEKLGQMPLPPYIRERLEDPERYQTVYSKELGSAAAPTAGLHFTNELIERIHEAGIQTAFVTLHVGLGTFRPVKEDNILDHKMHTEYYVMPAETADLINKTKAEGGRIVCVGTTSCRTVESCANDDGTVNVVSGNTGIFIYPGYRFKTLDALITNFHLPESTLVMLVSALAGRENILNAYRYAVDREFRFFSFGDAMFIQ